eukprot:3813778-Amphidinium_carterae.1
MPRSAALSRKSLLFHTLPQRHMLWGVPAVPFKLLVVIVGVIVGVGVRVCLVVLRLLLDARGVEVSDADGCDILSHDVVLSSVMSTSNALFLALLKSLVFDTCFVLWSLDVLGVV